MNEDFEECDTQADSSPVTIPEEHEVSVDLPKPTWIPTEQIDFAETGRLRENDNPKIVKVYSRVLRQNMDNGKSPEYQFPPCGGYQASDGRYVITAGRHRALAAKAAGVKDVLFIIFPTETEAVWYGLGDNRRNGLRNSLGDKKKMIGIALRKYAAKSNRAIAEHIGCSPSYVDQIARQLRTSTQLPETRKGRDGKRYPSKKPKLPKTTKKRYKSAPASFSDLLSAVETNETGGEDLNFMGTVHSESDSIDAHADPESEIVDDFDIPLLESPELPPKVDSSDTHAEAVQSTDSSFELPDLSDGHHFIKKFNTWLDHLPLDDKGRLELYKPLISGLLKCFEKNDCRLQFVHWLAEHLKFVSVHGH